MSSVDPTTLAQVIIQQRLQDASRVRLARECRRSEKPDAAPSARRPRRARLGVVLAHLRSAYG